MAGDKINETSDILDITKPSVEEIVALGWRWKGRGSAFDEWTVGNQKTPKDEEQDPVHFYSSVGSVVYAVCKRLATNPDACLRFVENPGHGVRFFIDPAETTHPANLIYKVPAEERKKRGAHLRKDHVEEDFDLPPGDGEPEYELSDGGGEGPQTTIEVKPAIVEGVHLDMLYVRNGMVRCPFRVADGLVHYVAEGIGDEDVRTMSLARWNRWAKKAEIKEDL